MRALTFGLSAGISAVDLTEEICEELLAGDVIVCEISSAKRLAEALQRKKTKVQAIVRAMGLESLGHLRCQMWSILVNNRHVGSYRLVLHCHLEG